MLEYSEVKVLENQVKNVLLGKEIIDVLGPTKPHKFCWFTDDPNQYVTKMKGAKIVSAKGFGIFFDICLSNGYSLAINDGVNMRYQTSIDEGKDYQLKIVLGQNEALVFTVAMYGGIMLHENNWDNEYYQKSRNSLDFDSPDFYDLYLNKYNEAKKNLSAKAFIATEQRFPGLGNGLSQEVLFAAKINPKRKLSSLSNDQIMNIYKVILSVTKEAIRCGGRDTEKDLYGNVGGYKTKMSKNAYKEPCQVCGGKIIKEQYLGGSIYYCENCQGEK